MDNSVEMKRMLDAAMKVHPESFAKFDRTKNVQDQLQEMVRLLPKVDVPPVTLVTKLRDFIFFKKDWYEKYSCLFSSMEQLWLAAVMHEKYGKTWNGQEWVR